MGKLYRDKKSSGCALCRPYKHGWEKKFTPRELAVRRAKERELLEAIFPLKTSKRK